MDTRYQILALLADGHFHSGEVIGAALGISRAAVWKHLQGLQTLGVDVFAVRGRGYALSQALELLDAERVTAELEAGGPRLSGIEIHPELDSTNRYLAARAQTGLPSAYACLAERQTHGRGRRGRAWVSPFGRNLYLSLYWCFPDSPETLAGLSLAVGVAVARALAEIGLAEVRLKWPNDLFWSGAKLGGVLLEMAGESAGPCHVVIGVGVNISMPDDGSAASIDQPWADVSRAMGRTASRNQIAGVVLRHVLLAASTYQADGIEPFLDEWRARDLVNGLAVELRLPDRTVNGTALGVDAQGALLLEHGGGVARFAAGEVSLRLPS